MHAKQSTSNQSLNAMQMQKNSTKNDIKLNICLLYWFAMYTSAHRYTHTLTIMIIITIISSWISIDEVITLDCTFILFFVSHFIHSTCVLCFCAFVLFLMHSFPNWDSKSNLIAMSAVLYNVRCFVCVCFFRRNSNIYNVRRDYHFWF